MALKLTKKPATATSETVIKSKGEVIQEKSETEVVDTPAAASAVAQLCEVGVEASYTHNLGNFQSARVQVSLKVPCEYAEIDSVFEYAQGWVDGKMQKMMEDLQGAE